MVDFFLKSSGFVVAMVMVMTSVVTHIKVLINSVCYPPESVLVNNVFVHLQNVSPTVTIDRLRHLFTTKQTVWADRVVDLFLSLTGLLVALVAMVMVMP
jgi:hypothetical protein